MRQASTLGLMIANSGIATAKELRGVSGMSASTASRAIDKLAQLGLIERGKNGRDVTFFYGRGRNALLHKAMPMLSSPVAHTVFAKLELLALTILEYKLVSWPSLPKPGYCLCQVCAKKFPSPYEGLDKGMLEAAFAQLIGHILLNW